VNLPSPPTHIFETENIMSDTEKPAIPATTEKKPPSTAEADLTKYKVRTICDIYNCKRRKIIFWALDSSGYCPSGLEEAYRALS
jgi:hypothetical protein